MSAPPKLLRRIVLRHVRREIPAPKTGEGQVSLS